MEPVTIRSPDGTWAVVSVNGYVQTTARFDGRDGNWIFLGATEVDNGTPGRVATTNYDESWGLIDSTIVITKEEVVSTYKFVGSWDNMVSETTIVVPVPPGTEPPVTSPILAPPTPVSSNIIGTNKSQQLLGTKADNTMKGLGGNDKLFGFSGADRLVGGKGNDQLWGGEGKDVFVFDYKPSKANKDIIKDFKVKDDTICLNSADFTKVGKDGTLNSAAFYANKIGKAHDLSDRVIYDKDSGVLYYDQDGTGKSAGVAFATISKNLALTYKDFVIL